MIGLSNQAIQSGVTDRTAGSIITQAAAPAPFEADKKEWKASSCAVGQAPDRRASMPDAPLAVRCISAMGKRSSTAAFINSGVPSCDPASWLTSNTLAAGHV